MLPAFRGIYHEIEYSYDFLITKKIDKAYVSSSEPAESVEATVGILYGYQLLEKPDEKSDTRYWPGDQEEGKAYA